MSKVSVIIPTYNRTSFLNRAIQSILNQTYQNFELLVVDDASTDNTEDVVKSFNDNRIQYLRHNENRGLSAARNSGIEVARGKYVSFLDDDDEFLPQKLEKQINKFEPLPSSTGVVYSGFCYVDKNGHEVLKVIPTFRGNIYAILLKYNICAVITPLIRKDCFQKAGLFDESLHSLQDWDLWIRISKYFEFDFVADVLAKYYVHGKQMSVDVNTRIRDREALLKKHGVGLREHPAVLSEHLRCLSKLYYMAGKGREGRRYILKAIKIVPFNIRNYMHLLLSLIAPKNYEKLIKERQHNIEGIRFY